MLHLSIRARHECRAIRFYAGFVDFCMNRLATQGVDVVIKHLLQVNQAALARAITPVLQG